MDWEPVKNPSLEAQAYAAQKMIKHLDDMARTKAKSGKKLALLNLFLLAINSFFLYQDPSRVLSAWASGFHMAFLMAAGMDWYFNWKFLKETDAHERQPPSELESNLRI